MNEPHHRRDFVRALTIGAIAVPSSIVVADDEPKKEEPKKDEPKTEVDARMEYILARFGKLLDDDARKTIRAQVESLVKSAETLRKIPLDNGDGPFPVFHPYRAPLA